MDRSEPGYSVVEILVVAGIVAILAVAALWQVGSLADRLALRSAAANLVSDLRLAQSAALAERDPDRAHGVEFPADGDRYVTFVRVGPERTPIRNQRLPARVRISYARFGGISDLVMFTGVSLFGAPSGGGTVTFSAGSAVLCVRVQPATGRIRVADSGCP